MRVLAQVEREYDQHHQHHQHHQQHQHQQQTSHEQGGRKTGPEEIGPIWQQWSCLIY